MTPAKSIKDWKRMFDSLTNPEIKAEAKRKAQLEKIKSDKISDTGL